MDIDTDTDTNIDIDETETEREDIDLHRSETGSHHIAPAGLDHCVDHAGLERTESHLSFPLTPRLDAWLSTCWVHEMPHLARTSVFLISASQVTVGDPTSSSPHHLHSLLSTLCFHFLLAPSMNMCMCVHTYTPLHTVLYKHPQMTQRHQYVCEICV